VADISFSYLFFNCLQ